MPPGAAGRRRVPPCVRSRRKSLEARAATHLPETYPQDLGALNSTDSQASTSRHSSGARGGRRGGGWCPAQPAKRLRLPERAHRPRPPRPPQKSVSRAKKKKKTNPRGSAFSSCSLRKRSSNQWEAEGAERAPPQVTESGILRPARAGLAVAGPISSVGGARGGEKRRESRSPIRSRNPGVTGGEARGLPSAAPRGRARPGQSPAAHRAERAPQMPGLLS